MKTYLLVVACAFMVASALSVDLSPPASPQPQVIKPVAEATPEPSKPVAPVAPQPPVTEVKARPEPQKISESLVTEETKAQAPALAMASTESDKNQTSKGIPINVQPIVSNNTEPGNSTPNSTSKTLSGMSMGTVALIVVCVLAVVVLSVGLLQYLLKSRRMSSRS